MKALIKPMRAFARKHWSRKTGQTLVEYALVTAMVSIVMVAVFALLDSQIAIIFSKVSNTLDTAQSSH